MKVVSNPEISREVLQRLRDKYLTPKPLPHVTELIYCLTRSYWDRLDPIEPTDHELLLFAVGFGLEEMLLRQEGQEPPKAIELDGITLTPDYIALRGGMVDLKSTRAYPDKVTREPGKGWSETWQEQFMAYAKAFGKLEYTVTVVYIIPAEVASFTFVFTEAELGANWQKMLQRKAQYMEALEAGKVPTPFTTNREWECRFCRYLGRCNSLVGKEA